MTHPCKDCPRKEKINCSSYRDCDKFCDWLNAVWAEIQAKFAEIAKRR